MEPYEITEWQGDSWRIIYQSPTKLTDSEGDEDLLTSLVSTSSKNYPPECIGMVDLLARPFCIERAYPHGSRFRKAGLTPGVYYAAEKIDTALAEAAFYLVLDYLDSKSIPFSQNPKLGLGMLDPIFSSKSVSISETQKRNPSLSNLTDYSSCQDFAENVRKDGVELIRYNSVRDKNEGINLAVLSAKCLAAKKPYETESWALLINSTGVIAKRKTEDRLVLFDKNYFAADPRLADFHWDR